MASFSWKAVLVSQRWCHSKKADFTFVFTTPNGQECFPCWWPSSIVLWLRVTQHIFRTKDIMESCPNLRRDLNNFFSNCIVLTACLCLHEATHFMTFKEFFYNIFPNWYYISIQLLSATKSSIRCSYLTGIWVNTWRFENMTSCNSVTINKFYN